MFSLIFFKAKGKSNAVHGTFTGIKNMKEKKFLVFIGDEAKEFFFVYAPSKKKAIDIFSDFYAVRDASFIEDFYDKSINMGFSEKFWMKTEGEQQHFMESGGEITVNDDLFIERVFDYFHKRPKYAKLYIDYYFNPHEGVGSFPDEMIKFTWKKEVIDGNWCEVRVVCCEEIKVI